MKSRLEERDKLLTGLGRRIFTSRGASMDSRIFFPLTSKKLYRDFFVYHEGYAFTARQDQIWHGVVKMRVEAMRSTTKK